MKKDEIEGGKADEISAESIAKKHDVSLESIKSQIEIGKKIEMEHTHKKELAEEIAMDHIAEIPDYYTRLKNMEKEAKKELNLEARKFMALAGIKEDDKKFLNNESYQENVPNEILKESMGDITSEEWAQMHPERQQEKDIVNPDSWKGMDSMRMGTSSIPELDHAMDESEESVSDSDFIITEFDQIQVEPGEDDDVLYKIG